MIAILPERHVLDRKFDINLKGNMKDTELVVVEKMDFQHFITCGHETTVRSYCLPPH